MTVSRWINCCLRVVFVLTTCVSGIRTALPAEEAPPFTVPDGFSVQLVADDSMVHDCFCMTLDGRGRPVVSGPGYIRTLVDDNEDGKYDRSFLWSNQVKQGAQGLWSEGRTLYYVSDGGLWKSEDANGDLIGDPNPKKVLEVATGGEHFAHAIRRGPDGYWYLIAGNFAKGIAKLQNDPNSPVPRSRSGTLWRISPDFSKRAVWAHGMRNCYDFDFLPDGQAVTFDSDCEREASLPWYRPTRVMVLGPGSDAGWCGQSWKDEDHRITMPLVLAQLGRGSPTGVAVYQHRTFPKKYHDAVFVLDWTFGRVIALHPAGNLEEAQRIPNRVPAEVFMQSSGTTGFAPTDICVAPDGSLLICVGGRGTTGGIYRVLANSKPTGEPTKPWLPKTSIDTFKLTSVQTEALERLLSANCFSESWSRSDWTIDAEKAGMPAILSIATGEMPLCVATEVAAAAKLRCAQILTSSNAPISFSIIQKALTSPSRSTRAASWWLMGRGNVSLNPNDLNAVAATAAFDFSASAMEVGKEDQSNWELHLGPADQRLRWEAFGTRRWSLSMANSPTVADSDTGNALRRTWLWALSRSGSALANKTDNNLMDALIAKQLFGSTQTALNSPLLDAMANWIPRNQPRWKTRDELEFLTVLQAALGDRHHALPQQQDPPQPDVLDGYKGLGSAQLPENVRKAWIGWTMFLAKEAIQTDRPLLFSEATRTLAMLEPKDVDSVVYLLTSIDEKSHPTSDIHSLCCAANCSASRSPEMTRQTASALAGIVRKVKTRGLYTDNQWPFRLQQLVAALLRRDPGLAAAFVELPVPCCPEDLVLVNAFPLDVQASARRKMRDHLVSSPPTEWSIAIMRYASQAGMDDTLAKAIRNAADLAILRPVAIDLLSADPQPADYDLFVTSLESQDRNQWPAGWKGLSGLPITDPSREWTAIAPSVAAVINSNSALTKATVLTRARSIASKLQFVEAPTGDSWKDWEPFLKETLVDSVFESLSRPQTSVDWQALLQASSSLTGDSKHGQIVYQEKCALCHGGQSSLGPSLAGVAMRFSRADLSKAIFEPSRDISDRFRSIRVLTTDGEIFTGMIVYNAADGTTLQTATGSIVRINQEDIEDKGYSTESLMPSGLLDEKSPADVADLFAYLSTLK